MPLNLASPGIVVREVDLTIGRVDPVSGSIGAQVAPFSKGPVDLPQLIENEDDLLDTFGRPYSVDKHYEHWMVASSYLAYGGVMRVSRADDQLLKNAFVGAASSIKIKSTEHYEQLGYDENPITNVTVAARNPGTWANGIKVAIIDGRADQILSGVSTAGVAVGYGFTAAVPAGTILAGAGTTSVLDGHLSGTITEIGAGTVGVKVLQHVSVAGTRTNVDYTQNGVYALPQTGNVAIHTNGTATSFASRAYTGEKDWFENQEIALSVGSLEWDQLANRPGTSDYVAARGGRFDEVHVVIIDDKGTITGNAGSILEKHLNLSKAKDAEFSVGSPSYWRKYLYTNSEYIFGGSAPVGVTTIAHSDNGAHTYELDDDTGWDQKAENVNFGGSGVVNVVLAGGLNYGGKANTNTDGALNSGLDDIITGLTAFENTEEYEVDFILMGSANYPKEQAQALANKCIAAADVRKDAIAFISPYRKAFITDTAAGSVTVNDDETITTNVLEFYSPITSSSYAVFDSGYKYMFDKFNDVFRFVPLNGDIAGLCANTDTVADPFFSPGGFNRGQIRGAVKLAFNPTKAQRDILYPARVNPVVSFPGQGTVLFGDKTALSKPSAFDRINVRRLFILLEKAIATAAKFQLFEFNDEFTRAQFRNLVEPFLRDIQGRRGITDFSVVADGTNNTGEVIDRNEFVADIFIKPARSINFIQLNFIAVRTGVAFSEIGG